MKKILKKIFSVENSGIHKVITILGIKIKFIPKNAKATIADLETKIRINERSLNTLSEIDKDLRDYICDRKLYRRLRVLSPMNLKFFHLEVNLVDHCNLNCKGCDHFSPLAKESYLDVNEFERDMKQLASLSPAWTGGVLSLLGGEALLHKDIVKFLEISRHYFPNIKIMLWSNGLLLKQHEDIFKDIKRLNIHLEVTTYPVKYNYEEIDKLAKKYKILYNRSFTDKVKKMCYFPLDLEGKVRKEAFIGCGHFNECRVLRHGKIYTCPIIPYSEHFNKYFNQNLQISPDDYIDIYKVKGFDEIAQFCAKRPPFCRYCDVEHRKINLDYEISKKSIQEWT